MKQMVLACHYYHELYRKFPPAWGPGPDNPVKEGSIHFHLLPFLEQDQHYKSYAASASIPPFQAPVDPSDKDGRGVQDFAANLRLFSKLGQDTAYNTDIAFGDRKDSATWDTGQGEATFKKTITDGSSNTIMFATRFANADIAMAVAGAPNCSAHGGKPYHKNGAFFGGSAALTSAHPDTSLKPTFQLAPPPGDVNCRFSAFAHSFTERGLVVGIADGAIRFLNPAISAETWNRAMQPNDGQKLGEDWDE